MINIKDSVRPKQTFRCFGISADAEYSAKTGQNKFILPKQAVSAEIKCLCQNNYLCRNSSLSAETVVFLPKQSVSAEVPKEAQKAETVSAK